ncbi:MAG: hypothetical protein HQL84_17065 [Magnetococcales bacterium]|nr:hypothetical protein [Magnetococcales bacterium]
MDHYLRNSCRISADGKTRFIMDEHGEVLREEANLSPEDQRLYRDAAKRGDITECKRIIEAFGLEWLNDDRCDQSLLPEDDH